MRHRRLIVVALLVAAVLAQALPPSTLYRVRRGDTHITFTITKWSMFKEHGRFRDFSGAITYDPDQPSASRVDFTVQASSIDTQNETRDGALRSDAFFDAQRHPTLTFRSTSVAAREANLLDVTGDLTIKGVTKRITIPVRVLGLATIPKEGSMAGFETSFILNRMDFGVRGGEYWSSGDAILSHQVQVSIVVGAQSSEP
jgi:polyisoprenoid-binding protein YceI